MKTIVYISGPIKNNPDYQEMFNRAEELINKQGLAAVNPARVLASLKEVISREEILDLCLKLMEYCDMVYMLPGWRESLGASMEYGYAVGKGMKIHGAGV